MTNTQEETTMTASANKPSAFAGLRKVVYALGILLIVWFVFGEAVPRYFFAPEETPPIASTGAVVQVENYKQQIEMLNNRIDALEVKLKTFEEVLAATPANVEPLALPEPAPLTDVDNERMAKMEERMVMLQSQLDDSQTKAEIKIATISTFSQMREAALRGDAFANQLAALEKLSHDNSEAKSIFAELKTYSEKGVATPRELEKSFAALVPKALAPATSDSLLGNVSSLVSIRKVGEPAGSDDQAVIARAETKLERGDLDGAKKELAQLSPPAASIFAGWIADAQNHEHIRTLCDDLERALSAPQATETLAPAQ